MLMKAWSKKIQKRIHLRIAVLMSDVSKSENRNEIISILSISISIGLIVFLKERTLKLCPESSLILLRKRVSLENLGSFCPILIHICILCIQICIKLCLCRNLRILGCD